MANVKITELTAETNPVSTDVLPIVDVSADVTKKITIADLLENAGDGSASACAFAFDGDADTGMYRHAANVLAFGTGGTGRLFVNSNGNIGINSSSPAQLLDISDDAPVLRLTDTDTTLSDGEDSSSIEFYQSDAGGAGVGASIVAKGDGSAGNLQLQINTGDNNEAVRIAADGRVGINNADPLEKFHITAGDSGVTSAIAGVDGAIIETGSGRTGGLIFFTPNDRAAGLFFGDPDDSNKASYRYSHSEEATVIYSNGSERFRIKSDGNVGINNTNPAEKLHVGGNIRATKYTSLGSYTDLTPLQLDRGAAGSGMQINLSSAAYELQSTDKPLVLNAGYSTGVIEFELNSAAAMRLTSDGFGVGTTAPTSKLHVKDNTTFGLNSNTIDYTVHLEGGDTAGDGNYGASLGFGRINSTARTGAIIATKQTSADADQMGIAFLTHESASTNVNMVEQMLITHDGKIGVGSSSPEAHLHVNDASSNAGIAITASDSSIAYLDFGDQSDRNAGLFQYNNSNNSFTIRTGGSGEDARITSGGKFLIQTSTARQVGAPNAYLQLEGSDGHKPSVSLTRIQASSGGPYLTFGKARGTQAVPEVVQNNDNVGQIEFAAHDGSDLVSVAASIHAYIDGTPGSNDVPGRLSFRTTADGSASPTEHLRISNNGDLTATDTTIGSLSDARLKTNVSEFTYDLEDFKQYRPKTFDWINPELHGNHGSQRGFIAQDVEAIDSYWVDEQVIDNDSADAELLEDDCISKTLKLGKKDAMYVSVIQQLLAKVETLEAKVAALEAGN